MKKLLSVFLAAAVLLSLTSIALAEGFKYNFDTDLQGWTGKEVDTQWSYNKSTVSHDTTFKADGNGSMKVVLETGDYYKYQVFAPTEGVAAGKKYTYKVYVPEGEDNLKVIQPFVQWGDNWEGWESLWYTNFKKGQWNEITWTLPDNVGTPIQAFGIQFESNANPNDKAITLWIDSVDDGTGAQAEEDNPQTGYASMLPFVLLAGASGVVLLKSRKK